MQYTFKPTCLFVFLLLLFPAILFAQPLIDDDTLGTGPVGETGVGDTDATDAPGPGVDDFSPYPGPLGRVDDREPHSACDTCFTVPGLGDGYQIFEQIGAGEDEILLPRRVPNPAPLQDNEIRERIDEETDEDIWYIGTQAFIGPTDEEYWSAEAPRPTIELKRIQMKYLDTIMRIPGVHGFGISPTGFGVIIDPTEALSSEQVPLTLDGVPVTVDLREPLEFRNHLTTKFRPVPSGAGIAVRLAETTVARGGSLGPHVVRTVSQAGKCCQLWSLTAAHVVKYRLSDTNPTPGTRSVYQPYAERPPAGDAIGTVAHTFQLAPCGSALSCESSNAPKNWTHINPDIAAINHGFVAEPFNHPTGTKPTRHLQESADEDEYINGPSGKIMAAWYGHKHRVWGAATPGTSGRVALLNTCTTIRTPGTSNRYRVCGVNMILGAINAGDSGALVAYAGTSNRHVAGVAIGSNGTFTVYVPADDIMTAFANSSVGGVSQAFNHFWGTKSSYRQPATTTCDEPDGC